MKLPNLAIKNAQFTLTIVVLLVLVGIVSYLNMPRSEDPQFDIPITLIEVIYPGASPTDIETLVVDPLEASIKYNLRFLRLNRRCLREYKIYWY